MKLPKEIKRLCPYCKTHQVHKLFQVKKRQASSMTKGSKHRARKRGQARGIGNLGRYSKPAVTQFKSTGKKASKKMDLRYECKTCHKKHVQSSGKRAKRVEFV